MKRKDFHVGDLDNACSHLTLLDHGYSASSQNCVLRREFT
jgi:hypothetical protein